MSPTYDISIEKAVQALRHTQGQIQARELRTMITTPQATTLCRMLDKLNMTRRERDNSRSLTVHVETAIQALLALNIPVLRRDKTTIPGTWFRVLHDPHNNFERGARLSLKYVRDIIRTKAANGLDLGCDNYAYRIYDKNIWTIDPEGAMRKARIINGKVVAK